MSSRTCRSCIVDLHYPCSGSDVVLYVFVVAACRRPDLDVLSRVEGRKGAADVICSRKGKEAAGGGLGAPDLLTQGDGGASGCLKTEA